MGNSTLDGAILVSLAGLLTAIATIIKAWADARTKRADAEKTESETASAAQENLEKLRASVLASAREMVRQYADQVERLLSDNAKLSQRIETLEAEQDRIKKMYGDSLNELQAVREKASRQADHICELEKQLAERDNTIQNQAAVITRLNLEIEKLTKSKRGKV